VTTYYVGNHYEVKSGTATKYYFAGSTRLAARSGTGGTLSYLLGDHIGSSSVTTDASGVKTASALYKAFGETRYTLGNLGTDYKFTGHREEASLGIYFFNARWFDPSLGRFISPDTIVPTGTQGTQAWDRYAFVNNNPVRYNDPTGHMAEADNDQSYQDDPPPPPEPCTSNSDPKCVVPPPPLTVITQATPNPYGYTTVIQSSGGYIDWLHVVTNGAALVADASSVIFALAPESAPITAPVTVYGKAISFAGDVYDAANRDFSAITLDLIGVVAEGTKLAKYLPIINFGTNLNGFINAFHAGQTQGPVLVPIPPPIITTP
jgi:RHS repeat-associated protein